MQTLPKALFAPRNLWCLVLLLAFTGGPARGQTQPLSRITHPIDDRVRVTLSGNVHPLAQPQFDQGAVPDNLPAERMVLLLQRSPERASALRQFLLDAHTQGSPSYHHWLTPEQFGALYGPTDSEVAAVSAWLQQHGFSVARVSKAKNAIEFSGTAGQFRGAFNTELHTYVVKGETHHAINRDPQIPATLAPVVAGITPLNDFRPSPQIRVLGTGKYGPKTHVVQPDWTIESNPPLLALAPGDFAVQYDLNPLYSAGTNGTGVTIGIISASDVLPDPITNYRSFFGLPPITLNTVIDGLDPGPSSTIDRGNWAEFEAVLDVEISGAVAPNATINLYAAADTTVQSGLLLAAQRAVEDNIAAVLTTSYGECESSLGVAGNQFWAALWEQAAAQGQTSFVSSGDNGPAGCDDFNASQAATHGLAVNGLASTPWNIAVGGTDFYYSSYNGTSAAQSAELATYWNMAQTFLTPSISLLKPVPEQPWNRAFGLNLSTGGVYDPTQPTIVAGSGGASSAATATGGYPKPAWQSGKGVPPDGVRHLPDVSLFSADGENGSSYPVCLGLQDCNSSLGFIEVYYVGGTSAASPEMAAIMALINQKYGRQGQANFIFYPLAAQHPSAFHDVTVGSIKVPCSSSFTPGCALSAANDNTKGFDVLGYYAGPGYDQSSGLGSVDVALLAQYWNSLTFAPSSTSLNLSQTTFTHGTPVTVNVSVTGNGGTPSGDVGLLTTQTPANASVSLNELTLKTGAASSSVNNFPGGQYQLTARYTGDTVFAPSTSAPISLNVTPENSTVSLSGSYWNNSTNNFSPLANGSSFPFGTYVILDAQPLGVNAPKGGTDGIPSGTVTFTDTAGSNTVTSSPISINSQGVAEWQSFLSFPLGASSVSASYSGDASFNASASSAPLTFTITQASTQAFLFANPSPVAVGSSTTLYMSVGNTFSGPPCPNAACTFYPQSPAAPTGTVTFTFGTTTLGTLTLAANYNNLFSSYANLTTSALPLGKDLVTASYSGDANYAAASSSFTVSVENVATIAATANPNPINQIEFTAITATVSGGKGMPVPTGCVEFDAPAGSFHYWTDRECLVNGSATSVGLSPGAYGPQTLQVTVSYLGDANYGPASINIPVTVVAGTTPPFTLSATPVTIFHGATVGNVSSITVTPATGFTGSVYLSCALKSYPTGAIDLPTCSVAPSAYNVAGANPVAPTMTVYSTARSSSAFLAPLPGARFRFFSALTSFALAAIVALSFLALIFAGVFAQTQKLRSATVFVRRNSLRLVTAVVLFSTALVVLASCGGLTTPVDIGPPPNPGTTPGTYTFTVGGAFSQGGVPQAQTTVTVTIQ